MSLDLVSCFTKGLTAKVLSFMSFIIPGMGESGDYCMKGVVKSLSVLGNAAEVVRLKCGRIQCPNCCDWWISERTFKLAFLIEAYARVTGDRPAGVVVSVHPDSVKSWTWGDYNKFFRNGYNRLKVLGALGGVRVFHPFRVKDFAKSLLRKAGYGSGSGFWKGIRADALNLGSWRSYVYLAPHFHAIVFPSWLEPNVTSDIVIKKYSVFGSVRDTVAHLKYLLSHCGLLADSENEPATEFGCLHGFKPEKFLSESEIVSLKKEIAETMGLCYDVGSDSIFMKEDPQKDDKYEWIPIREFATFSSQRMEYVDAYLNSIPNKDHRLFVQELIWLYNDRLNDDSLCADARHVFIEDLVNVPEGFEIVEKDL